MPATPVPTRAEMIRALRKNHCTIKFRKTDGTTREARGTLIEDEVPYYDGKPGGENRDVIAFYDLDKYAWRSFRVDSVKSFKIFETR